MNSDEPSVVGTMRALYDALQSAQSVADQLGLSVVAIRLDGALIELQKAIDRNLPLSPAP